MKTALCLLLLGALAPAAFAADAGLTDAQLDAAMARADSDGNGEVGLAEARRFGITMDTFRKVNPDRDGSLDRAEFAAAIREQFGAGQKHGGHSLDWPQASRAGVRSREVFDASDPDGDGRLGLAEYLSALTAQAK